MKGEGTVVEGVGGDEEKGGGNHGCKKGKNLLDCSFLQLLNIKVLKVMAVYFKIFLELIGFVLCCNAFLCLKISAFGFPEEMAL